MLTCQSPRTVMIVAHWFAVKALPQYTCRYSRKDFTLPQLFACLVLREMSRNSYRKTEALLKDSPEWCRAIGMSKAPDHATLHRAADLLTRAAPLEELIQQTVSAAKEHKMLGSTAAIDSTQLDVRYRSRHYEQRCRHHARAQRRTADAKRSRTARTTPKLTVATAANSHFALSFRTRIGMGSDAPDFLPVIRAAKQRHPGLKLALADAGFDSHENHREAREELSLQTLIKVGIGRPTTKPLSSKYRRRMQKTLAGSQKGKPYGQRAQAESFNSMFKRNLGDHLRARSSIRRKRELSLRVIVHNLMILRRKQRVETEPSRLSRPLLCWLSSAVNC